MPELGNGLLLNRDLSLRLRSGILQRVLARLDASSEGEILECIQALEDGLTSPWDYLALSREFTATVGPVWLKQSSDLRRQFPTLNALLARLYRRIGNYSRAYLHARVHCCESGLEWTPRVAGSLAYLRLRGEGLDALTAPAGLGGYFDQGLIDSVSAEMGDPEQTFHDLQLPLCGDCSACPARSECLYDDWARVDARIQSKIRTSWPDQERVRRLFEG